MALPDFLIIGAMKCGTSTLQAQLAAQPGVFMTTPKEPNFFSDDDVYAKGLDWYEGLFADAAPGDLKGEASTHYTKLPTHPNALPRLAAVLTAPRLIYMIRDPVDRTVSHYIHEWSMGVMSGDMGAALDQHPELTAYSRYAMQIAPWADAFGRDSIHMVSLEAMRQDPQATLSEVGRFLGLPEAPVWQDEQARVNVSAERIRRFPLYGLIVDNPVATALRRALVPQGLRDAIKRRLQMRERPELPADRRRELETLFAEDYRALLDLFPDRGDLAASYPFLDR